MKLDRIMWGIVLLFIGSVLLLENFNVINFYWGSVWRFWPIFLIIAGVNILFSRSKSQVGGYISIGVLVVMLSVLFYRGMQEPTSSKEKNFSMEFNDDDDNDKTDMKEESFVFPFEDVPGKKTVLNISGGGTSYALDGETDSLFIANAETRGGGFVAKNVVKDSLRTVNFEMNGKKEWNMGEGGNDIKIQLNTKPLWEMHLNMGAGEINFDLSPYKVREFNFDGGAAALDIKFGDILPITDVKIKTGVADVKLSVPMTSGCRITTKSGLSSKDFEGFTKLKNNTYETPNYSTSTKKIFISLNGGLSNFEVKRY